MQIIAIANQKGGVGKTATTHALAVVLSERRRVLMIDADPQSSLSQACGVADTDGQSLAEVLGGAAAGDLTLSQVVRPLGDNLFLAPGDIALASVELGLVSRMGREGVLSRALRGVEARYDLALIDCPPSLGLLSINALTAADGVLIPTQPEIMGLRGLSLFLESVERVRQSLNEGLEVIGILPTFFDARLIHHQDALETIQRADLPLLDVTIGRSIRVAEAANEGESVVTYEPSNKRASEYRALGEEIERWLSARA